MQIANIQYTGKVHKFRIVLLIVVSSKNNGANFFSILSITGYLN